MKAILEIFKNHGITIASGLVLIGAMVFGFLGLSSDTVKEAMAKRRDEIGANSISGLRSNPKNEAIIAAEEKRVATFQSEFEATTKAAEEINLRRKPLLDGVFPTPANDEVKFRFDEAYQAAVRRLPIELDAGTLPTEADYAEERQNVEEAIQQYLEREEEEGKLGGQGRQPAAGAVEQPFAPPPPPVYQQAGDPRGFAAAQGFQQPGFQQQQYNVGGNLEAQLTPEQRADPKFDVTLRARVAKAKSIRMYFGGRPEGDPLVETFDVSPIYLSQTPPTPVEMWTAQMSLWIQQDVVAALKSLNEAAAASIDEPYVEHMPVKRLSSIRVFGYEGARNALPFGGGAAAAGGAGIGGGGGGGGSTTDEPVEPSLSGLTPNPQFDMIRFQLVVVVDQRDILRLIDAISRQNFYQCIDVSYQVVDRAAEQAEGFYYGSDPVVRVTLDFEGYFLRQVYQPLMPAGVKTALKIEGGDEESGG